MAKAELITFQKFDNREDVELYTNILSENNIPFYVSDESYAPDVVNGGLMTRVEDYRLKLLPANFDKANTLLESVFAAHIAAIEQDYFLYQFTNEELLDVLRKPDEWGHLNYALAKKILGDKGVNFTEKDISEYKAERIEELAKPETASNKWVWYGYIAAIGGLFAITAGVLGIFTGLMLFNLKKTLPNGTRVYAYTEHNRKQGRIILIIAIIITSITAITRYVLDVGIAMYGY